MAWQTAVRWRRGPLGGLHAQWADEEISGASCCSESAALSGPDEGYSHGACRACVALALSLGTQSEATCSVRPEPRDWRAMRKETARRRALVMEAARHNTITQQWVMTACQIAQGAANMMLRKMLRDGTLRRVEYGKYTAA